MKKKFYTHSGFFHADEVTAYAILELTGVCDGFFRLTDLNNIPDDGFVADIGREWDEDKDRYDHHQGFYLRERDGYPMASAGMVWESYWLDAIEACGFGGASGLMCDRVVETLIRGIDAHDADSAYEVSATCSAGKVRALTISHIIAGMNGEDVSDHAGQAIRFRQAADLMKSILVSQIKAAGRFIEACNVFDTVAEIEGQVITLSEGLPWKEIVHERHPNALYVISPSNHPGNPWSMVAVPVEPESREVKQPIERPEWFSGFIHQGKWIAGGSSPEELKRLANFNITETV